MHGLEIVLLQLLRNNKQSLQQVVFLGKSTNQSMLWKRQRQWLETLGDICLNN